MLADLDLLLIAVFCTADDLLPARAKNARRSVTDAEVVSLCVAQAIMGIPSDARFLAVAAKRLAHLFPRLPQRPGYWKRRQRLADVIEALIVEFARLSPGFYDDLLVVDSTRSSARARSRRSVAARWATRPTTGTAAATVATSGASDCTDSSRLTEPHARSRSPPRRPTSARSVCN